MIRISFQVPVSPNLQNLLRGAHDDGARSLVVVQVGGDLAVARFDGSDLSPTELREVLALLAANAVDPVK